MTVRFQTDPETYSFSKRVLTNEIDYFKSALRECDGQALFLEGQSSDFHLKGVSAASFGTCLRWTISPPGTSFYPDGFDYSTTTWNVDQFLQPIVAASYLGMDSRRLQQFARDTAQELRRMLLFHSRSKLQSKHIDRVLTHPAFGHSEVKQPILDVFVDAAIRPTFEQYILDQDLKTLWWRVEHDPLENFWLVMTQVDPAECNENIDRGDRVTFLRTWAETVRHYMSLTSENPHYAAAVFKEVSKHTAKIRVEKRDPWSPMAPILYYMDPLAVGIHKDCKMPEEGCQYRIPM